MPTGRSRKEEVREVFLPVSIVKPANRREHSKLPTKKFCDWRDVSSVVTFFRRVGSILFSFIIILKYHIIGICQVKSLFYFQKLSPMFVVWCINFMVSLSSSRILNIFLQQFLLYCCFYKQHLSYSSTYAQIYNI